MKELSQLPLNQTQKIRLQKAFQQLQEISSPSSAIVTVGDTIPVNHEDSILKGHGTSELNAEVVTTLCGVVERINKLVYVRALRARYKPEVGDIIVGRVLEIAPKRWRLEVNFSQDAVSMLSSMNMPDGIQRRWTAVDELNMRSIFEENGVISMLNKFSCIALAGIATEYLLFGYAEGGLADIDKLDRLLESLGFTQKKADSQALGLCIDTIEGL